MPSSPPASLQQRFNTPLPAEHADPSPPGQTSSDQGGGGGGTVGEPGFGDVLGLQMNETTADLGGLELMKSRRGMMRELEVDWRERWDQRGVEEEVEEREERDALGLKLGKRRFDEFNDDEDTTSPPSPTSSSPPETPADRRPLPIIRLIIPRVAIRQEEAEEELQPSSDFTNDKEQDVSSSGNGSEWTPPSNTRSKGKTSMRLVQDRNSPSVEPSSSPSSSSKRKRMSSSSPTAINQRQTRRRTASSSLSASPSEDATASMPVLRVQRNDSASTSSTLSSPGPTPPSITKQLPTSAYSSLAAASSYPQPGSQYLIADDEKGEEGLAEPFDPPSPAPSSPLSSAPPSPQPVAILPLPEPTPSDASQSPLRRSPRRRASNQDSHIPSSAVTRRTFKPTLEIEPGFDRWYRNCTYIISRYPSTSNYSDASYSSVLFA